MAELEGISIRYYDIIYKLLEDVKARLTALLEPEILKKVIGKAEVLAIFKVEAKHTILGLKILEGKVNKGLRVNVYRKKELLGSGESEEVQVGKEKVSEVVAGQDCGVSLQTKAEIKVGDLLEFYSEDKIIKKL